MRAVLIVIAAIVGMSACVAHAADATPAPSQSRLVIYSTIDRSVFDPVLDDFRELHPGIAVRYELIDAAPLYERHMREVAAGEHVADLLLSTAMDLQVKLVNDGYATPHVSENARALPAWARWRDEAFGFTFEPAVMVFNRGAMRGVTLPKSRAELLDLLKHDARWSGRIGSYDISRSSVGYLLASQDARQSSEFGALVEAFGDARMQTEENTSTLLDRLESGDLAIGYNLLGSYARARVAAGAPLDIVYPQDHTLVVSRTAVVPRDAPHAANAHRFLEYLLSLRGQRVISSRSGLPPVRRDVDGPYNGLGIEEAQVGILRPIALGPGLLVYLDAQKRRRLLQSWRAIVPVATP